MTVFLCEPTYEGILSCIYDAGMSKIPQNELRLEIKNIGQDTELFAVYRECSPDAEKVQKVIGTVCRRLNSCILEQLYAACLSQDVLRADKMYRYLKVLFLHGAAAADQLQIPAVHEVFKLCRSVYNEKHQFIEFLRFSQMDERFLAGKIQPKNDILELIAPYFADRLPEENWLICDVGRGKAAVHEKGKKWLLAELSREELEKLKTEKEEKEWEKLWKTFFTTIAIEQRKNPDCQRNHLPLRFRLLMTEFAAVQPCGDLEPKVR